MKGAVLCYSHAKQCWHRFDSVDEMLAENHAGFVQGGYPDSYTALAIGTTDDPVELHAVQLAYAERYGRPGLESPRCMGESRNDFLARAQSIQQQLLDGTYQFGDTGEAASDA